MPYTILQVFLELLGDPSNWYELELGCPVLSEFRKSSELSCSVLFELGQKPKVSCTMLSLALTKIIVELSRPIWVSTKKLSCGPILFGFRPKTRLSCPVQRLTTGLSCPVLFDFRRKNWVELSCPVKLSIKITVKLSCPVLVSTKF